MFCSFEQSDVGALRIIETWKSHWNKKTKSLSGTLVFDPVRCAHLPGNELKIDCLFLRKPSHSQTSVLLQQSVFSTASRCSASSASALLRRLIWTPSSLDDVRARAGRHRPVCGRADAPAGSSSGNVLFRSTSSTTMSFRVVSAYSSRVGGNQETPSLDRSHTRRSHRLCQHSISRPTRPRRAHQQHGKTPQSPGRPHRARLVPRHVGPVEDRTTGGACSGACAKSSACVLGCSTGSTRTLPTAGNGAHQQKHSSAGRPCCHPQT